MKSMGIPITQSEMSTPTTMTKCKKPRRKYTCPEIGSLYDILHDHAGVSLFVSPICWTDLHTKLLARFVQLSAHNTPIPPSSPRHSLRTPRTVMAIGRSLDILMSRDKGVFLKNDAMSRILSTLYPEHLQGSRRPPTFDLVFGGRRYRNAVRCGLVCDRIDPDMNNMSFDSATTLTASQSASHLKSVDPLLLAYMSRSHLDHVRRNCFRVLSGPKGAFNHPVHRLQVLRSKNLLPKNIDEDAYFLAIMIALAQESVYTETIDSMEFRPRDVKVRVLTEAEEESAFMVYTATVPAAFLTMLHEPYMAPAGNPQIEVEYTQVPVWPVLGLKERLGKALGADVVGNFDGVPMDTYESEVVTPEFTPPKRRRDALAEVFNTSFSEDRESDIPGVVFGKRRCIEEVRVGVVR